MAEKAPSVNGEASMVKQPLTEEQKQHVKAQMANVQKLQEKIASVQEQLKSHMEDSLRKQAQLSGQIQQEIQQSMQQHVKDLVAKRQRILDSLDAKSLTDKKAHILKLQGEQLEQYRQLMQLQEHISKLVLQEEAKPRHHLGTPGTPGTPLTPQLKEESSASDSMEPAQSFVFKQPKIIPAKMEKQKHREDKMNFLRDNKAMFSSHEMSPGVCMRTLPRSVYSSPRDWRFRRLEESPSPNFDNIFGDMDLPNLEFSQDPDPIFNSMVQDDYLKEPNNLMALNT